MALQHAGRLKSESNVCELIHSQVQDKARTTCKTTFYELTKCTTRNDPGQPSWHWSTGNAVLPDSVGRRLHPCSHCRCVHLLSGSVALGKPQVKCSPDHPASPETLHKMSPTPVFELWLHSYNLLLQPGSDCSARMPTEAPTAGFAEPKSSASSRGRWHRTPASVDTEQGAMYSSLCCSRSRSSPSPPTTSSAHVACRDRPERV
jgi:hypothetical protein